MDHEGTGPQNCLRSSHIRLRPHETDEPTGAHPVVPAGQGTLLALVAEAVVGVVGPVEREGGVAGDLQQEQDDVVLVEDEVEWESEPQEVQLLRVLAQGDRLLVDYVQTAAAELTALQLLHLALPQLVRQRQPRRTGLTVKLRQLPVRIQTVHVVHCTPQLPS
jgi:hypothetical protein